jgi:hypothetical protein
MFGRYANAEKTKFTALLIVMSSEQNDTETTVSYARAEGSR